MKKIGNWLIDKWLAGFITATIFFIVKIYYDLPPDKKTNFFHFEWVRSIMNFEIKFWIVVIIVTFVIAVLQLSKWRAKQKSKTVEPKKIPIPSNPLADYIEDEFGVNNALWAWSYKYNVANGNWYIENVVPLCPVCKNKMEIDNFTVSRQYASCSKCRLEGRQATYQIYQHESDVREEIIRRANAKVNRT